MDTSLHIPDLPGKVSPRALLENYTTFRLGGPCRAMVEAQTPEELEQAVRALAAQQLPFILIGGGSNLVVSDEGVDTVVVRYFSSTPIFQLSDNRVTVSGSTLLDHLALHLAKQGLGGLNYTSGIPGTVGGAVVGNAGAFGKQVGDVLVSAELLSRDGRKRTVSASDLSFSYRQSNLRESGDIVSRATFALQRAEISELMAEREEILKIREQKHPDLSKEPCAGSFFRNIEPTSKAERRQASGWFLEQAGGKDLYVGGAKIFSRHANIIVKSEGCTALDVLRLSEKMQALVKGKFGLELVREVKFVGRFEGVVYRPSEPVW